MECLIIALALLWWAIQRYREKRRKLFESIMSFTAQPTYSSSHFKTDAELESTFKKGQILIGFSLESGKAIYYTPKPKQFKPLVCVGGMGSGKTSASQIPFGLMWRGSYFPLESTYETAAVVIAERRRHQPVYYSNPTEMNEEIFRGCKKVRMNFFGRTWLNPQHPMFGIRCSTMATSLIPVEREAKDKFFQLSERKIVKDVVIALVCLYRNPNIGLLAKKFHGDVLGFLQHAYRRSDHPLIKTRLPRYFNKHLPESKAFQDIMQGVEAKLDLWTEGPYAEAQSHDDIWPGELTARAATLIIANPMETMTSNDSATYLSYNLENSLAQWQSPQFKKGVPLCAAIDEFFVYPPMQSVLNSATTLRKYDVFLNLAMTDISALSVYGAKKDSFINSAGVVQWMAAKSPEGSEYLSRQLGLEEVETYAKNVSWKFRQRLRDFSPSEQHGLTSKPLLHPHEIRELPSGTQIVFLDGVPGPILALARGYYEIPFLKKIASANPFAPH